VLHTCDWLAPQCLPCKAGGLTIVAHMTAYVMSHATPQNTSSVLLLHPVTQGVAPGGVFRPSLHRRRGRVCRWIVDVAQQSCELQRRPDDLQQLRRKGVHSMVIQYAMHTRKK